VCVSRASLPGTPNTILSTDHLSRVVDSRAIVQEISIGIRAGEVLAVVGPSGSGKTSFLRLLNRLDEPTSGTVFLEGTDYRQIVPRELRRRVGLVTQRPFLFPGKVADNLGYGPRQRGESLSGAAAEALLTRVGLPGYGSRDVTNLSGGEAQRVSLARSLANSPEVLLMDEPTAALDEISKLGVESLIREVIRNSKLTCVIVTHDTAQAARMADRAMMLDAGRIVRIGSVNEVLHA
jgi:putative ABC transport system ATP-binding protein